MRLNATFVKVFLSLLLAVVLLNIVSVIAGFYSAWMGYTLLFFFVVLVFLFLRKSLKRVNIPKLIYWVVGVIVILVVGYLCFLHFSVGAPEKISFYDIGSAQDALTSYLSPSERVSGAANYSNVSYRNLTASLVYFNMSALEGENVTVSIRLLNNFPKDTSISLGIKNLSSGNYVNKVIYSSKSANFSKTGQWVVVSANFSMNESYLSSGEASMLISVPHLMGDQVKTNQFSIPIDWINVTEI